MARTLRKYGILFVAIFFVLVIGALVFIGMNTVKEYRQEISEKNTQITNLESTLEYIGDIQTGYVVTKNVRAGDRITEDVIQEVDIPVKIGINVYTQGDDIVGKYFKIGLSEGTVITSDTVMEEQLDISSRYYDVYMFDIPIGLQPGDYVDIRLAFPLGDDFLAIAHKKVIDINSGILKLELKESEIYTYRSMIVDTAIYGANIYAVQYIDAGAQEGAEVFYPLNDNLQELYAINPNITELAEAKMVLERRSLEESSGGGIDDMTERELASVNRELESIRNQISRDLKNAQRELERRLAAEAREAARNG